MKNSRERVGIYITRRQRQPWYKNFAIMVLAIILALVVFAIFTMALTGENPIAIYSTMFTGCFGTPRKIWILLQETAMLLCISLALTPAFKMRFWNLGAEGQILMGGLASTACMILIGDRMPNAVLLIVMTVLSLAAGAVWAVIPGIFKARWNTNETLFTLMMNYVATQIVAYFIVLWEVPKGSGKIGIINQQSQAGWFPVIGSYKYLLNIIIVGIVTVLMAVYMKYSKHGYELAIVGESPQTARYVGINVGRTIVRTMLLSGAVCGLGGLLLVASTNHTITTTIGGGRGFTAVLVAWLAGFSPVKMVFGSLLICFMQRGASAIATDFGLNESYGDILIGLILFFIIGSEFFMNYQLHLRGNSARSTGKEEQ